MKFNPLERLIKCDLEELREIKKEELFTHIMEWLDEKYCPVCMDWSDDYALHCPVCEGTRKIYIDYSHLYIPE